MPTNDDLNHQHSQVVDDEHPGYETTDANVGGVAVFLAGLFGFVLIFFGVCFFLGRVINNQIAKQDGEANKWHGGPVAGKGKLQNLAPNPEMQQRELQKMTATFPTPRLDIDDGNQSTADLHAREDLFLDHYSVDGSAGNVRIPINRAMELIAERGLPVNAAAAGSAALTGDVKPEVQAPLTTGFARTGYEIDVMESRAQKMSFAKAEGASHEEAAPAKK